MDSARWQRVEAAFSRAVELPATQRAVYVTGTFPTDIDMQTELRSLLTAHETSEAALDRPPTFGADTAEPSFVLAAKAAAIQSSHRQIGPQYRNPLRLLLARLARLPLPKRKCLRYFRLKCNTTAASNPRCAAGFSVLRIARASGPTVVIPAAPNAGSPNSAVAISNPSQSKDVRVGSACLCNDWIGAGDLFPAARPLRQPWHRLGLRVCPIPAIATSAAIQSEIVTGPGEGGVLVHVGRAA